MSRIEKIAEELITLDGQLENLQRTVTTKRDEMYGLLTSQPNERFEFAGYRFNKTGPVTYVTFPKQKVIEALISAGIEESVRMNILSEAMNESERGAGLIMSKIK